MTWKVILYFLKAYSLLPESYILYYLFKNTYVHSLTQTCRVCDEFNQIAEKAVSTPSDTKSLMELKEFMTKVENETIYELDKKLVSAKNRLAFLVDYAQFSPAEMRKNSELFQWTGRVPEIMANYAEMFQTKRMTFEDGLKVAFYRFSSCSVHSLRMYCCVICFAQSVS